MYSTGKYSKSSVFGLLKIYENHEHLGVFCVQIIYKNHNNLVPSCYASAVTTMNNDDNVVENNMNSHCLNRYFPSNLIWRILERNFDFEHQSLQMYVIALLLSYMYTLMPVQT